MKRLAIVGLGAALAVAFGLGIADAQLKADKAEKAVLELKVQNDSAKGKNEGLKLENGGLYKQIEGLRAENEGLRKQIDADKQISPAKEAEKPKLALPQLKAPEAKAETMPAKAVQTEADKIAQGAALVKEKYGDLTQGSNSVKLEYDHNSGNVYTYRLYEKRSDYNATLNWYDVNLETQTIEPMFDAKTGEAKK